MSNRSMSLTQIPGLTLLHRGKVRDVYALPGNELLIVASDRLSAFDVILPDPIPGKGEILTQLSNFWFALTADWMPNHLSARSVRDVLPRGTAVVDYERRSVVAKRLKPVPVEAIARGYIIGSGWKVYQATGRISGVELPQGLQLAERLREPIFTPSTKAAVGDHDENIGFGTSPGKANRSRSRTTTVKAAARSIAALTWPCPLPRKRYRMKPWSIVTAPIH